ncbi:hypothetical protein ACHAQG_001431 [Verticillium nonalfalfae]
MYDDSWYSFVPEVAKTAASTVKNAGHRRKESLLQQPNGTIQPSEAPEPLSRLLEDPEDDDDPPEPVLARRAKSYSDFYHVVRAQLAKDAHKKREDRKRRKDKSLEALMIAANVDNIPVPRRPVLDQYNDELLQASQHEYLYGANPVRPSHRSPANHSESIYKDQLDLTERHLEALIVDTNASLDLLTTLSNSFQAVETQTTSFQSQCEDLIDEQKRLQELADEVGTDLYFYTYLDNVTRRLNAPGAGRLVEDVVFGEVLDNLNACIDFMTKHVGHTGSPTHQHADMTNKIAYISRRRLLPRTIRIPADESTPSARGRSQQPAQEHLRRNRQTHRGVQVRGHPPCSCVRPLCRNDRRHLFSAAQHPQGHAQRL